MVDADVSTTSTEAPRIGRYSILRVLGEGAMGTVYAAYDEQLDRRVAVKVIRGEADESRRARMLREGQAMARLSHPNVVPVFEVGEHEASLFLAMEFVEGQTLREWSSEAERPWQEVVPMFAQAARGLHAAHEAGILHRDFKPDNVIVGEDGRVRVLDFGVSRAMQVVSDVTEPRGAGERPSFEEALTETGAAVGTPAYMAPEQFMAEPLDERTDVFAFCVALFEALFGTRPYVGKTRAAVLDRLVRYDPETPPERGVPGAIVKLVMQGIRPKPDERPQSMRAVLDVLDIDPHRGRKRVLGGAAVLSIAGLAAVGGAMSQPSEAKPCEGLESSLAGVWDDDVRADVRAAFEASASPLAERMWSEVESGLDERASQWLTSATDACTATRVTQTQSEEILDARMACLAGPLREMRELTGVLREPDLRTVALATDAVEGLADAQMCENLELLRSGVAPPPDADAAAQVESIREVLARAAVLLRTGHPLDAAALVEPLVEEADALGYVPLQAEVALGVGRIEVALGRYVQASSSLRDASLSAEAERHDAVLAEAAINQFHLMVDGDRRPRLAEEWSKRAQAAIHRLGTPASMVRRLERIQVSFAIERGDFATARQRAETFQGGPERDEMLARLAHAEGDYEGAAKSYQAALESMIGEHGRRSLEAARTLSNLAHSLLLDGRLEQARDKAVLAVETWTDLVGEVHPERGHASIVRGLIAFAEGETDEGGRQMAAGARAIELSVGAEHPMMVEALSGLGYSAFARSDFSEAAAHYRESLRILERAYAEPGVQAGIEAANLGEALLHLQESEEARQMLARADDILTVVGGRENPNRALPLKLLGLSHLQTGASRAALPALRESLHLVPAGYPYERSDVLAMLAVALQNEAPVEADAFARQASVDEKDVMSVSRRRMLISLLPHYESTFAKLKLTPK